MCKTSVTCFVHGTVCLSMESVRLTQNRPFRTMQREKEKPPPPPPQKPQKGSVSFIRLLQNQKGSDRVLGDYGRPAREPQLRLGLLSSPWRWEAAWGGELTLPARLRQWEG